MNLIFDDEYRGPRYRYGLIARPPSIGAVPPGYIIGSERKSTDFRFGTIDYPRRLTDEEVYRYELVFVGEF